VPHEKELPLAQRALQVIGEFVCIEDMPLHRHVPWLSLDVSRTATPPLIPRDHYQGLRQLGLVVVQQRSRRHAWSAVQVQQHRQITGCAPDIDVLLDTAE
jgi:hypothetical protein